MPLFSKYIRPVRVNSLLALGYRLSLSFFFLGLTRLFFYGVNHAAFAHLTPGELAYAALGALRFDTAAVCYLNSLLIILHLLPLRRCGKATVLRKLENWAFYIPNAFAITVNIADSAYFPFTQRRTTTAFLREFAHEGSGLYLRLIAEYLQYALLAIALILLMVFLYRCIRVGETPFYRLKSSIYYPVQITVFAAGIILTVSGMRGVIVSYFRPIGNNTASVYVDRAEDCALVLNTPFSLIRSIGKRGVEEKHFFPSQAAASAYFNPVYRPADDLSGRFAELYGRNVVIIIMESFSREFVGSLNREIDGYNGYTPNFDSIAARGYLFGNSFANGLKSIDAMPAALAGIPSPGEHFVLSNYASNKFQGLGAALGSMGYSSCFFHGSDNGSMGFDAFVRRAGFRNYFGRDEYNNDTDYDGSWGIFDEPFLQRMVEELDNMPRPFLGTVFTLSAHNPFRLPDKYKGRFPGGEVPLIELIGYADHAIGKFFRNAAKKPWFKNTLFVLMADHTSLKALPHYLTPTMKYAIPILFYAPGSNLIGFDKETVVQQADIMPSILSLVGYPRAFVAFGNNAFSKQRPHFAVSASGNNVQLIEGDYVLEFNGQSSVGLFRYPSDPGQQHDLSEKEPSIRKLLTHRIEAFIQQYNHRLITNTLSDTTALPR